jgi:Zinc-binding dehydrogenase
MQRSVVKSLGADTVIDYTKEDVTNRGELYDCIFDAVGKRKSSKLKVQCKKALTPNGKYILVDDGSPKLHIEDLILLKELVEEGKIKPVIDRCYPLEQIVEVLALADMPKSVSPPPRPPRAVRQASPLELARSARLQCRVRTTAMAHHCRWRSRFSHHQRAVGGSDKQRDSIKDESSPSE